MTNPESFRTTDLLERIRRLRSDKTEGQETGHQVGQICYEIYANCDLIMADVASLEDEGAWDLVRVALAGIASLGLKKCNPKQVQEGMKYQANPVGKPGSTMVRFYAHPESRSIGPSQPLPSMGGEDVRSFQLWCSDGPFGEHSTHFYIPQLGGQTTGFKIPASPSDLHVQTDHSNIFTPANALRFCSSLYTQIQALPDPPEL